MKNGTPENYEVRSVEGTVELRKNEDGSAVLRGLGAVFDSLSENFGGWRERIAPGAFDETDMEDVRGLFNHDTNFVLGRTTTGTVRLDQTLRGLEYEVDMPQTRTIQDLVQAPIERGDVNQSSIGFIVGRGNDEWEENDEGVLIRTIKKFQRLFDVSPVTFPAYRDTSVAVRCFEKELKRREMTAAEIEARMRRARTVRDLLIRSRL